MASIIVSQLILISVFRFWPDQQVIVELPIIFEKEAFVVEEMLVTRQANTPAAPPKPQMPIPVPNDEIIEDFIEFPELDQLISFDSLSVSLTTGQTGDDERISGNPDRQPLVVNFSTPILTQEATDAQIRAMVFVNFVVSSTGTVKEAFIAEIRLFEGQSDNYKVVNDLEYGILQDVIEAAYRYTFRPAEKDGDKIGAYYQDIILVGPWN